MQPAHLSNLVLSPVLLVWGLITDVICDGIASISLFLALAFTHTQSRGTLTAQEQMGG